MPPPDAIEAYKRVDSTFPERMLLLAENAQRHAHEVEKLVVNEEVNSRKRSSWMVFSVTMSCVSGAVWMGIIGQGGAAVALGAGAVASTAPSLLAPIFDAGKKKT